MNSGLCAEKQLPMSALVTVRKGAHPDSCVNLPLKSNMPTDHFGRRGVRRISAWTSAKAAVCTGGRAVRYRASFTASKLGLPDDRAHTLLIGILTSKTQVRRESMSWTKERPFQALALTGGGYRGLFTARALQEMEDHIGEPIGRKPPAIPS